ncbi:MAG: hypothetical protein LRY71_14230 [Bacillaceae bacterium]|nr:hypothetical protein [Bacillaceae bacterium]
MKGLKKYSLFILGCMGAGVVYALLEDLFFQQPYVLFPYDLLYSLFLVVVLSIIIIVLKRCKSLQTNIDTNRDGRR